MPLILISIAPIYSRFCSQHCKNKPLFRMQTSEIVGVCLIVFLSMFAIIAGMGGGSIFIPMLLLFFSMSQKEAIALSNGLTVFSSISKMIVSMRLKDPDIPHKTLINYEVMLCFCSLLMLGSAIGAIFTEVLAEFVPMVLFVIIITYSLYESIVKTISLCKKESEAARVHEADLREASLSQRDSIVELQ